MDSLRFVICARADCQHVFYLCRVCDRGDRYCSRACARRARRATLHDAGRRYQHSRRGRLHHAARQARYRARHANVTHQTSHPSRSSGIVPVPSVSIQRGGQEDAHATPVDPPTQVDPPVSAAAPRCARCGRPGRFLRQVTLAHLRPPRPTPRR